MTFHAWSGEQNRVYDTVNREYDQVEHHWEKINEAYLKEDNSGLAVWCMYDYNTLRDVNEPGIVWHGVCDMFRIPKFSYWWHMSELTTAPMAYIVRIDDTHAAVFSNCEKVRLWQSDDHRYVEVATQSPDQNFITFRGEAGKICACIILLFTLRFRPMPRRLRPKDSSGER